MLLWEFVLAADKADDLTAPGAAAVWLARHHAGLQVLHAVWDWDEDARTGMWRPVPQCWGDLHQVTFVATVQSLRSLAARLKRCKARPSSLDPDDSGEADRLLDVVLKDRVGITVKRIDRRGERGPLTRRTFGGLRMVVDVPVLEPEEEWLRKFRDVPDGLRGWAIGCYERLLHFQARAVMSLVADELSPVCSRCGIELGLTPKGRRPRAGKCKRCRYEAWKEKKGRKALQAMWRESKKDERDRKREEESKTRSKSNRGK
jgi:hypothetical protein